MSEDPNSHLQQATDFVNAGNYNEALEMARAVMVGDPSNGDAKLIEAISLSQLGNSRDASEAFAAAIRLAPTNVKARFNAAVHEFNNGNVGEARVLANEALSLDPSHEGTKELMTRMGPETPVMANGVSYPRENMVDFQPPHEGISFIRKNSKVWTAIGWTISAASLFTFVLMWAMILPHVGEVMDATKNNDQTKIQALSKSFSSPLLTMSSYGFVALNLVYMIMDIIHRKGNFIWLIVHIPCSCVGACIGGNFITLPIYMLFGRK